MSRLLRSNLYHIEPQPSLQPRAAAPSVVDIKAALTRVEASTQSYVAPISVGLSLLAVDLVLSVTMEKPLSSGWFLASFGVAVTSLIFGFASYLNHAVQRRQTNDYLRAVSQKAPLPVSSPSRHAPQGTARPKIPEYV